MQTLTLQQTNLISGGITLPGDLDASELVRNTIYGAYCGGIVATISKLASNPDNVFSFQTAMFNGALFGLVTNGITQLVDNN